PPAPRPSDVLSLAGFGGFANGFGTPAEFTAVLRTWEERFGAVLCGAGFADVRVLVTRPPTFEQTCAITSLPGRNRRCLPPRSAPRSGHCASGVPRSFTARLTARSGCCHSPRMGFGERVRYQTSFTDSARWDGFVFRPGDIVISAPAKCGTTWLQMICALEIFKSATFVRPLDQVSPWLDVLLRPLTGVLADLEAQAHRRFIKTHTPLD